VRKTDYKTIWAITINQAKATKQHILWLCIVMCRRTVATGQHTDNCRWGRRSGEVESRLKNCGSAIPHSYLRYVKRNFKAVCRTAQIIL